MKLVVAGIVLLAATISIGVGCGPKEKYCYMEQETCNDVKGGIQNDALYMPDADAEASAGTCFNNSGMQIPCE